MERKISLRIISVLLIFTILFASCASSTLIQSYPTAAKVYVDGESVGNTPYWHSDTKIIGSATNVSLVKEGYETLNTTFYRNEQVDAGAIIGGIFVWIPFLWTMKYKATHNYELVPLSNQSKTLTPEVLGNAEPVEVMAPSQPLASKAQRLKELKQLLDDKFLSSLALGYQLIDFYHL